MCGRFTLHTNLSLLAKQLGLPFTPEYVPRYNIAPTNDVLTVLAGEQGRTARMMRWGLIPFWADDPKIGSKMINARAETLAEKPAFRAALKARRCLVVADGYYEWLKAGKRRIPHYIHRADRQPFCFAGLWERWGRENPLESCTIITTEANSLTRPLHERMPVILDPVDCESWLNPQSSPAELVDLLEPFPSDELSFEQVNEFVNKVGNEGPECLNSL